MPQIGWFEILVVVVLAILIIGPKDFPIVIRKIGSWIGAAKRYFSEVQRGFSNVQDSINEEISFDNEKDEIKNKKEKNSDE
tara:strand:+ start:92 stop:334 length:243 start_codon:yes stop_codon:yes gene_type:complete